MSKFSSPLRYPGGKSSLTKLLGRIIELNDYQDCTYVEPYTGGAGAALSLLYGEHVSRIVINDFDDHVFSFWYSVLHQSKRFLDLLDNTPVTLDEWKIQRNIYDNPKNKSRLRVGFSAFYLNRCNRSGILMNSGPIGGYDQSGKWKIDARYNRVTLRNRIEKIIDYKDRIEVFNLDALNFMRKIVRPISQKSKVFVYFDPPYFQKGQMLYLNAYNKKDHLALNRFVRQKHHFKWLISYDNVSDIYDMYDGLNRVPFSLAHTAYQRKIGKELLIYDDSLHVPNDVEDWIVGRKIA